jgi:apoptosis-inducing factor 3
LHALPLAPLVDGIVVDDTVRCPWHHACFDLRTGEALRAPALSSLACWSVEQRDGTIFVLEKRPRAELSRPAKAAGKTLERIVIIGGGAAGFAAAERLRREQYRGNIVMLSNDDAAPIDRPNLSKDYLAGNAPEEWIPLRPDSFYSENGIDLRLKANVTGIDARSREVVLANGSKVPYDRLLLATGAEPVRLSIPGANQPHVRTLRSLADCRAIIERAKTARRAIVLGASLIGLEVAAALRARKIEVHVVAPEKRPMERILGTQIGDFVRSLHEEHGVVFHLEETASAIDGKQVKLTGVDALQADLVVAGIGVRPRIELAEKAELAVDRGVVVDAYLETSAPGIFAAGDIGAGRICAVARSFASSIGWLPSARGKRWHSICSGTARNLPPSLSSGASTTTSLSTMSAMPRNGTSSRSRVTLQARTASYASNVMGAC